MKTIKLSKHITIGQVKCWLKKDCLFERHGFNCFITTSSATIINIINSANRANRENEKMR